MNVRRAADIILSADFGANGTFGEIGRLNAASFDFVAAERDLRSGLADPDSLEAAIFAAAKAVSGRCLLASTEAGIALLDSLRTRVISEWRITLPELGTLQALYLVGRLEFLRDQTGFNLVLQLCGKPLFHFLQTERG